MAIVRHLKLQPLEIQARHTDVEATYSIVRDDKGEAFLQIDTYGSLGRKIPGKKSQSMRLSFTALEELIQVVRKHFPELPHSRV